MTYRIVKIESYGGDVEYAVQKEHVGSFGTFGWHRSWHRLYTRDTLEDAKIALEDYRKSQVKNLEIVFQT